MLVPKNDCSTKWLTTVVICTVVTAKKSHRQLSVDRVMVTWILGSVMFSTLAPERSDMKYGLETCSRRNIFQTHYLMSLVPWPGRNTFVVYKLPWWLYKHCIVDRKWGMRFIHFFCRLAILPGCVRYLASVCILMVWRIFR